MQLPLVQLVGSFNPVRTELDARKLTELTESMRAYGQVIPIKVRRLPSGDLFEVIYGHRRVAAARELGWMSINADVVDVTDDEALTEALIENAVRVDMSEMDKGKAVRSLVRSGHKLRDVGKMFGYIDRSRPGLGDPTIPGRWLQLAEDEYLINDILVELQNETGTKPRLVGLAAKLYGATPKEVREDPILKRAMARRILEVGLTAQEISQLREPLAEADTEARKLAIIRAAPYSVPPAQEKVAATPVQPVRGYDVLSEIDLAERILSKVMTRLDRQRNDLALKRLTGLIARLRAWLAA